MSGADRAALLSPAYLGRLFASAELERNCTKHPLEQCVNRSGIQHHLCCPSQARAAERGRALLAPLAEPRTGFGLTVTIPRAYGCSQPARSACDVGARSRR